MSRQLQAYDAATGLLEKSVEVLPSLEVPVPRHKKIIYFTLWVFKGILFLDRLPMQGFQMGHWYSEIHLDSKYRTKITKTYS